MTVRNTKTNPGSYQLRPDDYRAIYEAWCTGSRQAVLAAQYGVSRQRIHQILNEYDPWRQTNPQRRHDLTEAEIARIRELHDLGVPAYQIAADIKRTHTRVMAYLVASGLRPSEMGRMTANPWEDWEVDYIKAHYNKGLFSAADIGRTLNRTRNEVIGKAQRLGLCRPVDLAAVRQARKDAQQRMLSLRAAGYTYDEIADAVQRPVGSVSAEISRARRA